MMQGDAAIRLAKGGAKAKLVGNYFQQQLRQALQGEKCSPEEADFLLEVGGEEIGLEVKATNYQNPIRVPDDQFREHLHMSQFPLDGYWFAFFFYKNPRPRTKGNRSPFSTTYGLK